MTHDCPKVPISYERCPHCGEVYEPSLWPVLLSLVLVIAVFVIAIVWGDDIWHDFAKAVVEEARR